MKNQAINVLSRLVGKHFAKCYRRNWISSNYTLRVLDTYIALRRKLPVMADENRFGHRFPRGSRMRPWKATQGMA